MESSPNRKAGARILVVDDETDALTLLARLLGEEGFDVHTARDGMAALSLATEVLPDLVITDLKMPKMDGLSLLERLRHEQSGVPVIVMTAESDLAPAVAAMRAGAEDYIAKPVNFEALAVTVERALQHCSVRREAEDLRRRLDTKEDGLRGLIGSSITMQRA